MFIGETLPFIREFVDDLDRALKQIEPTAGLSAIQQHWLAFCLLAIMVTNSVCWKRFERASLGMRSAKNLSWMFRHTKGFWRYLLQASVRVILVRYHITHGVMVVDDSTKRRAKKTTRIYHAHTMKDTKSGGFINGQQLVLILLVAPQVTMPVGIEFYMPDPALTAWKKAEKRLKQRGVAKALRPEKPDPNPAYPTIPDIALRLLEEFHCAFPHIHVDSVLADNLYGTQAFLDKASAIFDGTQSISKLKKSQTVRFQGKKMTLPTFFRRFPGKQRRIRLRGGTEKTIWVSSARVHVCAHGKKRFVIALKYDDEDDYRYLVASDMSWRTLDIVQAHTLRWLIEVFFQDWKAYEGWGQLTKQPGEDGSRRSVLLSLLCDHCLLLHPDQLAQLKDKLPAWTVGSLRDRVRVDSTLQFFKGIVCSENPEEQFAVLAEHAKEIFRLNESGKHMAGRDLGRLEPTPSLQYRAKIAMMTA